MSSSELSLGDTEKPMIPSLPEAFMPGTEGYAWQAFEVRYEGVLSPDQFSDIQILIAQNLHMHGEVHVQLIPEENRIAICLCHTSFPASLHRSVAVWLSCTQLQESLMARSCQDLEIMIGEEAASAEEAVRNPQTMLPVYDWIAGHTPIPFNESKALRLSFETVLKKQQYHQIGNIMVRDLKKHSQIGRRCFGYIPILLEALWYMMPEIPTHQLMRGLDIQRMTRQPREALRMWVRTMSTFLESTPQTEQTSPIERVQQAVERDCSLPYSLERVSASVGLSPAYFSRLFHAQTGETFSTFLTRVRMEKARELMREGKWSLAEGADQCGYPSRSSFVRVFRNVTGMTPEAYRREPT